MAKNLLIVAIIISLATAGIGFVNHGKYTETKENLAATSADLDKTKKTLTATQGDLKKTTEDLATANSEKTDLSTQLTAAQAETASAKKEADEATKASAEKDSQITDLTANVKRLEDEIALGNPNPGPTPADNSAARIAELETMVNSLQDKAKTDASKIAIFEKEAADRKAGLLKKGLEGRVLAVNPAWNFVVLSIGDKQGVVNNAELLIKRSGQYLGKVRITSVEPSTSIADIVANTLPAGVAVQPGDSVIYQGN